MVRPEYIVVRTNNISCLRVALVTDPDDRLLGIVTDGNVRKALLRGASLDAPVGHHMNTAPITGRAGLARRGSPRRPAQGRPRRRGRAPGLAACRLSTSSAGYMGSPWCT